MRMTPPVTDEELKRHGVERVPTEVFLWGGFRYTHAADAIAAATRSPAK